MNRFKPFQLLWHPALYAVGLFGFICWLTFLADSGQPSIFFDFVEKFPYGDKLGHAGLFGFLALLVNLGLGFRHLKLPWIQVGSLIVLVFALGEELTQYFFPNRTLDPADAVADVLGVGMATLISFWCLSLKRENGQ